MDKLTTEDIQILFQNKKLTSQELIALKGCSLPIAKELFDLQPFSIELAELANQHQNLTFFKNNFFKYSKELVLDLFKKLQHVKDLNDLCQFVKITKIPILKEVLFYLATHGSFIFKDQIIPLNSWTLTEELNGDDYYEIFKNNLPKIIYKHMLLFSEEKITKYLTSSEKFLRYRAKSLLGLETEEISLPELVIWLAEEKNYKYDFPATFIPPQPVYPWQTYPWNTSPWKITIGDSTTPWNIPSNVPHPWTVTDSSSSWLTFMQNKTSSN